MNLYFKPAQLNDVQAAFRFHYGGNAAPSAYYEMTVQALSEIRDAFKGGRRALRFLERKPGESVDQWEARRKLFQNVPLLKHIIGSRAGLAYGTQPSREFKLKNEEPVTDEYGNATKPLSEALDEWCSEIYEYSGQANLFRKLMAPAAYRDSQSTIKLVVTDGEPQPYRLCYLPKQNACYVMDPEDAQVCLGVIECRKLGTEYKSTLHTLDEFITLKDDWSVVAREDNPVPGTIPFVPFSPYAMPEDFGNPLDDAVLDQKHLINVRSQMALGYRAGMFPVLFTTGTLKGQTYTGADGKERVLVSPEAMIEGENGATASYLSSNIQIEAYNAVEKSWLKSTLESYATSSYRVDATSAPEQPMAMLLKMQPSMEQRNEDIQAFECSEDMLARLLVSYAYADGYIDHAPDMVDFCVEYPESVVPMDKTAERDKDRSDVEAGLMLREDYVRKWVLEDDASGKDVADYLARLDQQAAALAQQRQASFPAPRVPGGAAASLLDRLSGNAGAPSAVTAKYAPPIEYVGGSNIQGGAAAQTGGTTGGGTAGGGGGGGGRIPIDGGGPGMAAPMPEVKNAGVLADNGEVSATTPYQDIAAVRAGLMLREDYIAKWLVSSSDAANTAKEYLRKLDAQMKNMPQPPKGTGGLGGDTSGGGA